MAICKVIVLANIAGLLSLMLAISEGRYQVEVAEDHARPACQELYDSETSGHGG